MTQKYQVKVSMKQAAIVETGIVLKQGDFGIQLEIEVLDFDATGTTPQIVFRKAMGAVESTTITVSGNKYTYTFKGTELDTPGKCFCDLKLKNSTTQRISTASFMFRVIADTMDGLNEQASSYSDTIAQIVGGFDDEINDLNERADITEETTAKITNVLPGEYTADTSQVISNSYINRSLTVISSQFYEYKQVTVSEGDAYLITTVSANNNNVAPIFFADAYGQYVGCYPKDITGTNVTLNDTIIIPSNVTTMYVNRDVASAASLNIPLIIAKKDFINIASSEDFNKIAEQLPKQYTPQELTIVDDKFINFAIAEVSNGNYEYTSLSVSAGEIYKVTTMSAFNSTLAPVIFADDNGIYCGKYPASSSSDNITLVGSLIEIPTNATTMYINRDVASAGALNIEVSKESYDIAASQTEIDRIIPNMAYDYVKLSPQVVDGHYISKQVRVIDYSFYEYVMVPVQPLDKFMITTAAAWNNNVAPIIFATNTGAYNGCYPASSQEANVTLENELITIPLNTALMFVNRDKPAISEMIVKKYDITQAAPLEYAEYIEKYLPREYNEIEISIVEDKYINLSLNEVSNTNYEYASVTLEAGKKYQVTTKSGYNSNVAPVIFADLNGEYCGKYPATSQSPNVELYDEIISIPSNAVTMYINRDVASYAPEIVVKIGELVETEYKKEDYTQYIWNAVGDSITQNGLYMSEVKNILGLPYRNCGVSSSTLAINNTYLQNRSIVERVTGGEYDDADIWTVMGGLNDCLYNSTLGEIAPTGTTFDKTTVYGALQAICEYILNLKEHPRLILVTPTQSNRDTWDPEQYPCTIASIRQAVLDVAKYYSLQVFDAWAESGINAYNIQKQTNPTTRDGVHFNELGADIFGEKMALEIRNGLFGIDN